MAVFGYLDEIVKNMLCILYPDDIHAPGLIADREGIVKKSVVKVLI